MRLKASENEKKVGRLQQRNLLQRPPGGELGDHAGSGDTGRTAVAFVADFLDGCVLDGQPETNIGAVTRHTAHAYVRGVIDLPCVARGTHMLGGNCGKHENLIVPLWISIRAISPGITRFSKKNQSPVEKVPG